MTKDIEISDYSYELPESRIAKYPLAERDTSKMLVADSDGRIEDDEFRHIAARLPEGSLMVFNNTRVIRARLYFHKETGALIEVFCLEPEAPRDYAQMFQAHRTCVWQCMVGNLKKWKGGALARPLADGTTLSARVEGMRGTSVLVRFEWTGDSDFAEVIEKAGELPIPPYLNRKTEESDLTTYQTVYSKIKGSVAAPTAGLHFTERVLEALAARGVEREEVTLHVGAGTFKPVKAAHIGDHEMHSEHIVVGRGTIERLIAHGGRCTAVGTTSVRTLESLYYIGVMIAEGLVSDDAIAVPQWIAYENRPGMAAVDALRHVVAYMDRHGLTLLQASTQIIIAPGYEYHIVERMVTNFHQPQSTLLLLVSAFLGGDRWRAVYQHALDNGYRFLSYGDCCLLNNTKSTHS